MKKWNNNRAPTRPAAPSDELFFRGARVEVRNNDVNFALRKLKKILERDNFQRDLAKHEYYEKPSVKRKRARAAAKKRWEKQVTVLKSSGRWNDTTMRSSNNKKAKDTSHPSKFKQQRGSGRGNGTSN